MRRDPPLFYGIKIGVAHEILVYLPGGLSPLTDAPDHKALAPAHVSGGEHLLHGGLMASVFRCHAGSWSLCDSKGVGHIALAADKPGGNQQKVVLAKWLSREPKVLILDNPTQGVDVGAKEEIYDIILKLAKEGVSVIVLSSEAQEIIRVCDRALVMYHGEIVGEVSGETMTEHEIMRLATGG